MQELKAAVSVMNDPPKLVGFLANTDPAARMYAEWTGKTSVEAGFRFELREVCSSISIVYWQIVRCLGDR